MRGRFDHSDCHKVFQFFRKQMILDEEAMNQSMSGLSVSGDLEKGVIQRNSFLHDNVD